MAITAEHAPSPKTLDCGPEVAEVNHSDARTQLQRMAAIADLVARVESADDLGAACRTIADQTQRHLGVERVYLALCPDQGLRCRLQAISGVAAFHGSTELAQAAEAVLQESIALSEKTCWPPPQGDRSGGTLAHQRFAKLSHVEAITSLPLRDARGRRQGAWMVTGDVQTVQSRAVTNFLEASEACLASALGLLARAEQGRLQQTIQAVGRFARLRRGKALLACAVVVALMLLLPVGHRVRCECTVEPVTRRFVAAPFDGPLEKALVEPGDLVEAGQLLARMDGREVAWELAGIRADLHRAAKQRAGHLATHASGDAAIAGYEVDRLKIRTKLLEHRDRNVELRSPIAGMVVSGDLKETEGMPLQVGQTLFEVAPLDEMVIELAVAEDDYAYVRPGMPVTIRLNAFPLRQIAASIERIHPRSEQRDEQNVFVAEVRPQDPGSGLRPGMRGTAHIESDAYPLGWNLFRRPFAAALARLGW